MARASASSRVLTRPAIPSIHEWPAAGPRGVHQCLEPAPVREPFRLLIRKPTEYRDDRANG
jgi:hypothetical protein